MIKIKYEGQLFGNRMVIRDYCSDEDWQKLKLKIPYRKDRYVLTKCLNCGSILPAHKKNLKAQPPQRCVFCSNIGNHSNIRTDTNSWTIYEDYAVCNIYSKNEIVSFYIDANDYDNVNKHTWRVTKKRQKYYVLTGSLKKNTAIYLHEMLAGKPENGYEVDHIDGNSLNNTRCNLRIVSRQENIDNQRATRIDNQIGIRGICWDKRSKQYHVDFYHHGKRFYTKPWKTLPEAVWCRYCFEDYFELPAIKNNPLAQSEFTLSDDERQSIQKYVYNVILRNER